MKKIVWIGRHETDILYSQNFFFASITYYGSNENMNYSFFPEHTCLQDKHENKEEFIKFVFQTINLLKQSENGLFLYFYDPHIAYKLFHYDSSLKEITLCLNSYTSINWLQNKSLTRLWVSKEIKIPPFIIESGNNCNYEYISHFFLLIRDTLFKKIYLKVAREHTY